MIKKSKIKAFLRAVSLTVIAAALILTAAACSKASDSGNGGAGKAISISAEEVVAGIINASESKSSASGIDTTVKKGDDDYDKGFKELYGIDENIITDGAFAYDSTGGTADEITVLRVKDDKNIDRVKQALQARMLKRQQDFGGYKPEESAKAADGKVFACSNYVFLGIADDSSAARSAFMKIMQEAAEQA